MDMDIKDYIDQKLLIFTTKDDVEKLRQEMRVTLIKFKEETKNQINELLNEIRSSLKALDLKMILEEIRKGSEKWQKEINSDLKTTLNEMNSYILHLEKDRGSLIEQFGKEVDSRFQIIKMEIINSIKNEINSIRDEEKEFLSSPTKLVEPLMNDLRKETEERQIQLKNISGDIKIFYEKINKCINDLRNDIGSMIKISYRDFEKRLEALEERIRAIEKIVFP